MFLHSNDTIHLWTDWQTFARFTKSSCKAGLTFNLSCLILLNTSWYKSCASSIQPAKLPLQKQIWPAGHLYFLNKPLTHYMKVNLYRHIWKLQEEITRRNELLGYSKINIILNFWSDNLPFHWLTSDIIWHGK